MFRRPSIRLRLCLLLTAVILLTAAVSGAAAFYTIFREAEDIQDEMLRQTALLMPAPQQATAAGNGIDNDIRVHIEPLANPSGRFLLPEHPAEGFYTLTDRDGEHRYRAYIHRYADNSLTAFIQETEFRDEVALDSAWYAVLPLLLLAPAAVILSLLMIHTSLRPIAELSQQAERRNENDLSPLAADAVPQEIYGFTEAINRLLARIGESFQRQQRFIADAAHELRTPMTALSLQAERLQARELDGDNAKLAAELYDGIRRNRRLLEQLLSMARAQADGGRTRQNIELNGLLRRLIADLYPLAEAKNIDLDLSGDETACWYGDETEGRTLLKTLLENAVRYTPDGGRIDVSVQAEHGGCRIEIEDNGPGIEAAQRSRVFDPFYRIPGSGSEGSGLGLSIAQTLAARYGGRITLSDARRSAHGLNVSVWLPAGGQT